MSAKRQAPVNIADLSVKLPKGMTAAGNSGSACYRWKPLALLHRLFHPRTVPPAKVFGREGRGEGEPFSKKVSLPASVSSRLFPFFRSSGVRCRPCCITFPLGDDWATSASQPATRQCPPAGERQASGARQALVTVQRSHPSPTKKSPAERGQKKTPSR